MTLSNRLVVILALAIFPFASFGQETFISDDFGSGSGAQPKAQVSNIKKMTRYSVGFSVDLPTMNDVLTYLSEDLGFTIHDLDQMNDPNWNPTSWTTRNCEVVQNEDGEFVVKMKFYPPVNPMEVEDVSSVQKDSRLLCLETIEQLKADEIN